MKYSSRFKLEETSNKTVEHFNKQSEITKRMNKKGNLYSTKWTMLINNKQWEEA